MAILKVICEPSPLLHQKAMKVEIFDENLRNFARDLLATMYAHDGCGLASVQVEDDPRVAFAEVLDGFRNQPDVVAVDRFGCEDEDAKLLVNARIIEHSSETETGFEGCVSVPNFPVKVTRFKKVRVKFQDIFGNEHEEELSQTSNRRNYDYIIFQHEIDHQDGITLITKATDGVNAMQKLVIWKKYEMASRRR